jgi:serine/threonine protein kinase
MRIDQYDLEFESNQEPPPDYELGLAATIPALELVHEMALIDDKELDIKEKLDVGEFGEVWLASWRDFAAVAVKIPRKRDNLSLNQFSKEIGLMQQLSSPFILKCHHFYSPDSGVPYAVFEYCSGGNLTDMLAIVSSYSLVEKLDVARQLAEGLYFMHDHEIIHLDIKPDNILLDAKGVYKIADFGFAIEKKNAEKYSKGEVINGTALWMAPEVLFKPYTVDYKNDVWSMCTVFWQIATGFSEPYLGIDCLEELQAVIGTGVLSGIENVEKNFRKIIEDGRKINHFDRSTATIMARSLSDLLRSVPQDGDVQPSEEIEKDYSSHSPNVSVSSD